MASAIQRLSSLHSKSFRAVLEQRTRNKSQKPHKKGHKKGARKSKVGVGKKGRKRFQTKPRILNAHLACCHELSYTVY